MGRFGKKNGYQTFDDKKTGREKFVHIRVMEKKLGGPMFPLWARGPRSGRLLCQDRLRR